MKITHLLFPVGLWLTAYIFLSSFGFDVATGLWMLVLGYIGGRAADFL